MKKVYKIIILIVSLALLVGSIFMIKVNIGFIKMYQNDILRYHSEETLRLLRLSLFQYTMFLIVNIISILLVGFFNFMLWFKQIFCFVPLTAEQKAERKKILYENKKKKLQEKLNKLN